MKSTKGDVEFMWVVIGAIIAILVLLAVALIVGKMESWGGAVLSIYGEPAPG